MKKIIILVLAMCLLCSCNGNQVPDDTDITTTSANPSDTQAPEHSLTIEEQKALFKQELDSYMDFEKTHRPSDEDFDQIKWDMPITDVIDILGAPHGYHGDPDHRVAHLFWLSESNGHYSIYFRIPREEEDWCGNSLAYHIMHCLKASSMYFPDPVLSPSLTGFYDLADFYKFAETDSRDPDDYSNILGNPEELQKFTPVEAQAVIKLEKIMDTAFIDKYYSRTRILMKNNYCYAFGNGSLTLHVDYEPERYVPNIEDYWSDNFFWDWNLYEFVLLPEDAKIADLDKVEYKLFDGKTKSVTYFKKIGDAYVGFNFRDDTDLVVEIYTDGFLISFSIFHYYVDGGSENYVTENGEPIPLDWFLAFADDEKIVEAVENLQAAIRNRKVG